MKKVKTVFMGTPEFALNTLNVLNELADVVLVVTKPDAIVGRKKELKASPVKEMAIELGIPVITPNKLKEEYESILKYEPELIVTCAYGKILPKEILDYPKYGCINIHGSILPKYRGAAPIQWALINGEEETGITLMYMNEGMDTGDIIDIMKYKIKDSDNLLTLSQELSVIGSKILSNNFDDILMGNIKRIKQNDDEATYAPMITRGLETLDFNDKGKNIVNKIRAFAPSPLVKTMVFDEEVKIAKAYFCPKDNTEINKLYYDNKSLGIGCIDGIIYIERIKPVGKKEMDIKSYLNGKKN